MAFWEQHWSAVQDASAHTLLSSFYVVDFGSSLYINNGSHKRVGVLTDWKAQVQGRELERTEEERLGAWLRRCFRAARPLQVVVDETEVA